MTEKEAIEILQDLYNTGHCYDMHKSNKQHLAVDLAIRGLMVLEERPTGEWIGNELGQCSICGHKGCASDIWNGCNDKTYCPNCGALLE